MSAAATANLLPARDRAPVRLQAWPPPHVDLYRACALCDHGAGGLCRRAQALGVPVQLERSTHGPCGPEARFMRIGGWDLSS